MKFVLVPVKDLSTAKQRLSSLMSQDKRTALAYAMLEDVLSALRDSKLADRICMVTLDQKAMEIAGAAGTEVIEETEQEGESQSVDYASRICMDKGAESLLVIPGDVPLVKSEDIDFILDKQAGSRHVVIVPARDMLGTNAILKTPPDVIPSRFGNDSYRKHIMEAHRRDIPYETYEVPRLALDIDDPEDLAIFTSQKSDTKTHAELEKIGIIDRISKERV